MQARADLRRRGGGEWAIRVLAVVIISLVGCLSISCTLAETIAVADPARAHAMAPWDGRTAALLALRLSGTDASAADRERADALAWLALSKDATAVTAVSTLGLNAQIRGDSASAQRLFRYADTLSRRDLPTQLWMIEDAVARNDIPGALRHYDVALRTSDQTHDILFPILASAMSDETIRSTLIRTLSSKPPWAREFVDYSASKAPDPRAVAQLFVGLARANASPLWGAQATVVNRLVSSGLNADAWNYYATIKPSADPRFSRDPNFRDDGLTPSAFDWTPITNNMIQAAIQPNGKDGVVDFSVSPGNSGVILQQLQMFPRGNYSIEGLSSGIDRPEDARPFLHVRCQDGHEVARVTLPQSGEAAVGFSTRFTIPEGCTSQMLELIAMPSDGTTGVAGQVQKILVRPTGR